MLYEALVKIIVSVDDDVARLADEGSGNTGQAALDMLSHGLKSQFTDFKVEELTVLRDLDDSTM